MEFSTLYEGDKSNVAGNIPLDKSYKISPSCGAVCGCACFCNCFDYSPKKSFEKGMVDAPKRATLETKTN